MGRRKLNLTPEEIEQRRRRWFGPERNQRRREKYRLDRAFRDATIQGARQSYQRRKAQSGEIVREDDCQESLSKLTSIGNIRTVEMRDGTTRTILCFTMAEAATAFMRDRQVVYRWCNRNMLPKPTHTARNDHNRLQNVYTEKDIRALIGVLSKHQRISQYYRKHHVELREKLFEAVSGAASSNIAEEFE